MNRTGWLVSAAAAAVVLVAIALFAFGVVGGGESRADVAAREVGSMNCVKESGLPGAATGKLWYTLGTLSTTPIVVDGRAYEGGDKLFLGYCGPDGKLIH